MSCIWAPLRSTSRRLNGTGHKMFAGHTINSVNRAAEMPSFCPMLMPADANFASSGVLLPVDSGAELDSWSVAHQCHHSLHVTVTGFARSIS